MYCARDSHFRQYQFDKQVARFVNDVFEYSEALNKGVPCDCDISNTKSILVDWEDTALNSNNINTSLEDLVLDRIITQ